MRNESSENEVHVFELPGNNIAVPLCGTEKGQTMVDFVHVRDLKCGLDICNKRKSKKHTLVVKEVPVCPHVLLGEYRYCKTVMIFNSSSDENNSFPV